MKLSHLIKLTRPVNLVIIALTMYLTHWVIWMGMESQHLYPFVKFHLAVLVMVCLAAAGNIINDYFDLRVDRINKPEKVLVGKYVKRRVAMASHQFLNGFAVLLGIYLAYDCDEYWLGLIPIFIATTLWYYSIILKKKVILGNLAIAVLVALVPLYAGAFDFFSYSKFRFSNATIEDALSDSFGNLVILLVSFSFGVFGFMLTLIREAQKDLEDLEGDTKVGYLTLPIRFGIKKTKNYLSLLFVATIGLIITFLYAFLSSQDGHVFFIGFAILMTFAPILKSWWITIQAQTKSDFHRASFYSKLAMLFGMLFLAYLWYTISIA